MKTLRRLILFFLCCFMFNAMISPASSTRRFHIPTRDMAVRGFTNWLVKNRDPKTLLPYSHIGDSRFFQWTMTYDSAIVSLAYIATDRINDAKRILDFYIDNPKVWRSGGIIDGINTHLPELGVSWTVRSGSNIWIGIASYHLYTKTQEARYLNLAKRLADFSIFLQNKNKNTINCGGIRMGPLGDDVLPGDQHIQYNASAPRLYDLYATEHNIDAYVLFSFLAESTGLPRYFQAKQNVLEWLYKRAFNDKLNIFVRGYNTSQDTTFATDVQSWAISALGPKRLDTLRPGLADTLIDYTFKNAVNQCPYSKNGESIYILGADFIDKKTSRAIGRDPLISPEWTFQFINAISRVIKDDTYLSNERIIDLKNMQSILTKNMLRLAVYHKTGLTYPYATQGNAKIGHEYATPDQHNFSAIGPAYGILTLTGFDPLIFD